MYIYLGFFSDDEIAKKRKFISENTVKSIKSIFNDYLDLNKVEIKGAIGFFKGKDNYDKPSFIMDIESIEASNQNIIINFNVKMELDITSGKLGKEIYKTARRMDWVEKETGYYPLLLMMDKQVFDSIRKGSPNIKKISSTMQKVIDLKSKNDWEGICNLYSPLEEIINDINLWNNADELYEVGFACSKTGEPQNGMERDPAHLKYIKVYRELSLKYYKRCYELESWNYRYASAVAYRHYQNVNELSKAKGRRDSNLKDEIDEANKWFDISLQLYPNNIKDNYRKGKLIIDKQLKNIRFPGKELSRGNSIEIQSLIKEAINCLEKVIETYENISDENKKRNLKNEYIKSLYTLGKFYCDEIEINWNEFLCSKIANITFSCTFYDLNNLIKSKQLLQKCFSEVTHILITDELDLVELGRISKDAKVSPIDILNSLGNIHFKMYYIKLIKNRYEDIEKYKNLTEYYLLKAMELRKELYKQNIPFRNTSYINNNIGRFYILNDRYLDAINLTRSCKESYVKNTYAATLILTSEKNNISEAKKILENNILDKYNLAKPLSMALLAKVYQLTDNSDKLLKFVNKDSKDITKSTEKLINLIL